MLVVLFSMFAFQVPFAYFLSQHTSLGVYGTRWAVAIGSIVMAASYTTYFKLGWWKRRKV